MCWDFKLFMWDWLLSLGDQVEVLNLKLLHERIISLPRVGRYYLLESEGCGMSVCDSL